MRKMLKEDGPPPAGKWDDLKVLEPVRNSHARHATTQLTFNAADAIRRGQRVLYVTERAVFELTLDGLALREVAAGVDMHIDVLDQIPWKVDSSDVLPMDARIFDAAPLGADWLQQ